MKKAELNKKDKKYLTEKGRDAISDGAFLKGIRLFERFHKEYEFDEEVMYLFGVLYDHMGQRLRGRGDNKNSKEYFDKAFKVFSSMLEQNPKSFDALYGIGKIYRSKGNYEKALEYSKKAYRMSGGKAVYGIGIIYEQMGDLKKAEYWYKKELRDKGENDYGAALNYVLFFNRMHREDVKKYAKVVKKHYDKESDSFKKSNWGKLIKKEIDSVLDF